MTSVAGHDHIVVRCLAVDVEIGRREHGIHTFAAVRAGSGDRLIFRCSDLSAALDELDAFVDGAHCLLGHNLIAFDLPHLQAVRPNPATATAPADRYATPESARLPPLLAPQP